ncbi:MAG: hypothetical protein FWD57_12885, partial [Polyangiaceae bacterium]|nr:hypothetical protein [Polyangiaceae bacterium]
MFRRFRLVGIASVTVLALGVFSATSMAAPKDDAARKLDDNAMNNDFLDMEFGRAEANLKKAIATCGDNGCSPSVKAQIQVHLGIVQFNNGNPAGAEQSFVEALQTHPSVVLDRDFASPDLQKIFDAAKGRTSSSAPPPAVDDPGDDGDAGDIEHQPIAEQMVNTPVPIWVTIADGMGVDRVVVWYKPFGGEWKKINLKKQRRGVWSALIDCNEVTTTGDLKYHINILDEGNDAIANLGSRAKPFVTKIKNQLDRDPQSLPNEPPPARCADKEDCPT